MQTTYQHVLPCIKFSSFDYLRKGKVSRISTAKYLVVFREFTQISPTFELHRLLKKIVPMEQLMEVENLEPIKLSSLNSVNLTFYQT